MLALVNLSRENLHRQDEDLEKAAAKTEDTESRERLEALKEEVVQIGEATLTKVSEQLGSNRGGWYENKETAERHYVKFYENPDQARVEFVANAVYEKLGIHAVQSELFESDDQLAIASKEIPGAQGTNKEDQKTSPDVRQGFVADAYLANWDVVGLVHDNVVRGSDDHFYRIDNGGSLTFRAQGGAKDFSAESIPELETMVKPEYPAGQVFESLTEDEQKAQAKELVERLSEEDIDEIIEKSGLIGEQAETIRQGLKGRREFLMEHFDTKEVPTHAERIPIAIEKLEEQRERLEGVELRPRIAFLADAEAIEGQQIDVIAGTEDEPTRLEFKLTAEHLERVQGKFLEMIDADKAKGGIMSYGKFKLGGAYKIQQNGITVQVYEGEMRAALGLVQIELPQKEGGKISPESAEKVNEILADLLEVKDGLAPPEDEALRAYKEARYLWHHKLKELPEDWEEREKQLAREEVFPGYHTVVEKERHKEYEKVSPYAIYHESENIKVLPKIIKAGGILSTRERYRRGLLLDGLSSADDMEGGGADSVFTRTITEAGVAGEHAKFEGIVDKTGVTFVFEPDLFDRTDWYAYGTDNYGSTDSMYFNHRQSPEELFDKQRRIGYPLSNEQMFRLGIPTEKIKAIVCADTGWREKFAKAFEEAGIEKIAGQPIEDVIALGYEATKAALEMNGIKYVDEESPEEIAEKAMQVFLKKRLGGRVISSADWSALGCLESAQQTDFFKMSAAEMLEKLESAGIELLHKREIGEVIETMGWPELERFLKNMEVELPGSLERDFADYRYDNDIEGIKQTLKTIGITEVGHSVKGFMRQGEEFARQQLEAHLASRGIRKVGGKDIYDDFEKMELTNVLALLEQEGFQRLGGRSLDTISNDKRDQVLKTLREDGITEINGKPIEEFVVLAKQHSDLIDITHGRPPRSFAQETK